MKPITVLTAFILICNLSFSQEHSFKIYDPSSDANAEISKATSEARERNKHVLLQIGGNWCKWCRKFYNWSNETPAIDSLIKSDFIVVHVNYSPENKNTALLKKLRFPQRFGFPVFVILNGKGDLLHTQNTAHLEHGDGYSEEKVSEFLKHWNFEALNEKNY